MNKDTIIGFVLIGLVIVVFTWLNQPTPEQIEAIRLKDSIARVEQAKLLEEQNKQKETPEASFAGLPDSVKAERLAAAYGVFSGAMVGNDDVNVLQNDLIELHVNNKGGRVTYARLKEYDNYEGKPLVLFENNDSNLDFSLVTADNRVVSTADMYFSPVKGSDANVLTMRINAGEGAYLDFVYTIRPDSYMVDFDIKGTGLNGVLSPSTNSLPMVWQQKIRQQEKGRKFEDRYAQMYYRDLTKRDVKYLSESKNDNKNVTDNIQWIAFKDMYFSTVLIADKEGFKGADLESRPLPESEAFLKDYKAKTEVPFDLKGNEATSLRYYFGPNLFPLLQSYDDGVAKADRLDLEKIVPLGWGIFRWVNQYFVIPLFNFLGKFISSYGLIIFLLTVIVKTILFPLTRKSYLSSAKMRVLRPQVEEINVKYPGDENAMERQRATMDLYSRAGASPMSGCLPMLLQMPVLFALFMFFPSAIELRHQSFLWAHDLSTYDAIVSWSKYIPIITPYFGNHISLFCLLMTVTNIVYSKYNAELTNTGQQQMPGMKAMIYLMPLMMLVFFNQYASGLTYYYFISTLITITQTLIFRYTINEDKLLAKLEANKRKPQKKSGFMKRLEEVQKMQQAQLEEQKRQRERNRR
jgi:YidC/Oxa1 family membrane protein insertase